MTERQAIYSEQELPEFKGNPLIEALPPIWDSDGVIDLLSHNDGHHDGERQLDARYRMHCVLRLFRYFQPLENILILTSVFHFVSARDIYIAVHCLQIMRTVWPKDIKP